MCVRAYLHNCCYIAMGVVYIEIAMGIVYAHVRYVHCSQFKSYAVHV